MERLIYTAKKVAIATVVIAVLLWAFNNPTAAGNAISRVVDLVSQIFEAIGTILSRVFM